MVFLLAGVIFDMAQVLILILILLCHLCGIGFNDWVAFLTTFLVVFIFFGDLGLGLSLRLTCINRKRIVAGLSLISILMVLTGFVFLGGFVALWVPKVDFFCS